MHGMAEPGPVPGRQDTPGLGVGVMGTQGMLPVPVPGTQEPEEPPDGVVPEPPLSPGMLKDVSAKSSTVDVIHRGHRYQAWTMKC